MKRIQTASEFLFKFTSWMPLVWLTTLYVFLISCIVDLGHYPQPSLNDPKYIGSSILYFASLIGLIAFFYGTLLCVASLLVCLYFKSVSKKHLAVFLVGLSIALIQLVYDPGQVIYWFLD